MDPVFVKIVLGTMLIAAASAVVGSFSFLKGQSLVGDAIAHALLPGVVLAFLMGEQRNALHLVLGAMATGLGAHYLMAHMERSSKLKADTATSLVLSTFFGFGIMLMSYVQRTGRAQQAGLDRFLLGKAAAITQQDLVVFAALALLLLSNPRLMWASKSLLLNRG